MPASTNEPKTVIASGRFLQLAARGRWEYVERHRKEASGESKPVGVVGVVAVVDGKLLIIEHYNLPHQATAYELPAGLVGDVAGQEGESLSDAVSRELMEETGHAADGMDYLATAATSCGLTNEKVHLFKARNPRKVAEGGGVEDEAITTHAIPLNDVPAFLADKAKSGAVVDMKIYAALFFAQ